MLGILTLVLSLVSTDLFVLSHGALSNSSIINQKIMGNSELLGSPDFGGGANNWDESRGNPGTNLLAQEKKKRVIKLCEENEAFQGFYPNWTVPSFAREGAPVSSTEAQSLFDFSLQIGLPFCGDQAFDLTIRRNNTSTINGKSESRRFLDNGYLQIGNDFYGTDEYCLTSFTKDEEVRVKICSPQCNERRPCIPKCLAVGTILSYEKRESSKTEIEYKPTFYKGLPEKLTPVDSSSIHPHYFLQTPTDENFKCTGGILTNPFGEDISEALGTESIKVRVRTDGRLFFDDLDDYNCPVYRELPMEPVCIDGIKDVDGIDRPFRNREDEGILFSCDMPSVNNAAYAFAFGIIMLISSSFLLLILIVYGLLWKQQNVHCWTVIGHTTSMFFAYVFVGMSHIMGTRFYDIIGSKYCYVHGVLTHFFFLSTFSWLTLISFDLWWTFRSVTPSKRIVDKRVYAHMAIGWGLPALIVFLSVCLDLTIGDQCSSVMLPKYGQKSCYLTPHSLGYYIYYPVALTLTLDVFFFCATLHCLYRHRKNTSVSKNNQDNGRQMLTLFSKLFFVMGITWIFELISWVHSGVQVTWFWAIADTINVLQSVAIFVIYVCKKDVMDNLEKTYPFLSKHLLKYIRKGCCKSREEEGAEDESDKIEQTLMTCSNHY